MSTKSTTRFCMCTAGGLVVAAAGAVGLSMMALVAAPAQSSEAGARMRGATPAPSISAKESADPKIGPKGPDVWIPGRFDGGVAGPGQPNDLCTAAIPIAVPSVTPGDTTGATPDGAPFCGTSETAPSVWYMVIGTGNTITATTCDSPTSCTGSASATYDTKISVYCGSCTSLLCVDGNDDSCVGGTSGLRSTVSWCSALDETYWIMVHGFSSASGPFVLEVCDDGVACPNPPDCVPPPPIGACCLKDGTCEDVHTVDSCAVAGGTYMGDGTDCLTVICPPANDNCINKLDILQDVPTPFDTTAATTDGPPTPDPDGIPGSGDGVGDCDNWVSAGSQIYNDIWYNFTPTQDLTYDISLCGSGYDTKMAVYDGCACPPDNATIIACNDDFCSLQSEVKVSLIGGQCYKIRVGGFSATSAGVGTILISKQAGPLPGACCFNDLSCLDLLEADCAVAGGNFQGDGTTCATTTCPLPNGACCLKDGTCLDVADAGTCAALGGTFQGAGTDCLTVICPPANDNCSNKLPIFNGKTPFDNTAATLDGPQCDTNMQADIWFNYTAVTTGDVTIDTCQDGPPATLTDTVLTVYDGCDCTTIHCTADGLPGQELASGDDDCGVSGFSSSVTVPVVAGNCYKIQLGGWNGATGSGIVTITKVAPEGACCFNDLSCQDGMLEADCTAAGGSFQGSGTTCATTTCPIPTLVSADGAWTANIDAFGQIENLFPKDQPTDDNVFETLAYEASSHNNQLSRRVETNYTVTIGPIVDQGKTHSFTRLEKNVPPPPPPCTPVGVVPTSDCAGATPIAIGGTALGTTVGAAPETALPTCGTTITSGVPAVWYSVVGDGGMMTASLCGGGTTYDSKLGVYEGPCTNLCCVGGNDDFCGLQSQVTWKSIAGTEYLIMVYGFSTNAGPFQLDVTSVPQGGSVAQSIEIDNFMIPNPNGGVLVRVRAINKDVVETGVKLFYYVDFDISGTIGDDEATLALDGGGGLLAIEQTDAVPPLKPLWFGGCPPYKSWEIDDFAVLRTALDAGVTQLLGADGTVPGPADHTAALSGEKILLFPGEAAELVVGIGGVGFDSCCAPQCAADLTGDCTVNSADLTILLGAWAAGTAGGDIDGDGDTDSADLTLLLGAWAAGAC